MRAALLVPFVAWIGLAAAPAEAFCRSTSCSDDCPRDENGCKTTGHELFWASSCVGFSIQKDGTANLDAGDVREVIAASFVTWSDLSCNGGKATIGFGQLADASCHEATYNASGPNANVVMFQDDRWTYTDVSNTLAKTTVSFDTMTGQIWDADIEINSAYNDLTVGEGHVVYDLQSLLTHEIGHFIGLDHSLDADATMNPDYMLGTITQRTLAPDDIAGACAAYPSGRDARCSTTPKGGFVATCTGEAMTGSESGGGCAIVASANGGWGGACLVAIALGAGVLRRRRRWIALAAAAIGGVTAAASCGGGDTSSGTLCDAGSVIFCKCGDGEDGSKTCAEDGMSFSACVLQSSGDACPDHKPTNCEPGVVAFCTCPDGEQGEKVCSQDGQSFGTCELQTTHQRCPIGPTTSSSGGGGTGGSGGTGGTASGTGGTGGTGGGPIGACPGIATRVSIGNDTTLPGNTGDGADREHDRCGGNGAPELAYQVTPGSSGTLVVTVNGIGQSNPVLYARGGDCETGVSLGCADATAVGGTETLTLEAVSGTPVWIFVDGAGSGSGNFSLNLHMTGDVPGDTCAGLPIIVHPGETVTAGGDTSIATANYKGTGTCSTSGTKEIVYAVKPSADGSLTVRLTPEFDAQLYARSGSCTTGTQLACSDNTGASIPEQVTFAVSGGSTYSVFADGAAGEAGPYTISFKLE